MTNGEKIKEIFPDGVLTSISNSYYWGDDILVHKSWWNAEYKETIKNDATDINVGKIEPTPKNNLGVDAVRRKAVLNTLDNMDSALDEDDRTVETYKELLKECYKVLPEITPQEPILEKVNKMKSEIASSLEFWDYSPNNNPLVRDILETVTHFWGDIREVEE